MLSSTGRIGRIAFLAAGAVLLALAIAFRRLASPELHHWTAWLVDGAILFSTACLLSKRLHDRGRAGWWAFAPWIALLVVWPEPHGIVAGVGCTVLALAFVDLGLLPGQRGLNRFGAPG